MNHHDLEIERLRIEAEVLRGEVSRWIRKARERSAEIDRLRGELERIHKLAVAGGHFQFERLSRDALERMKAS